jgi:predicted enzyme related to lactoylglutathione lyase
MRTIVYPVTDLERAKRVFGRLLGVEPYVDEPYYVGFRVGEQEVGLDPHGHRDGATGYWHVEDVEATLGALVGEGAEISQPATDVGGGKLTAVVTDADGNRIALVQAP